MQSTYVKLDPHKRGDTWEGLTFGPLTINDERPISPIVSCRIDFRDSEDRLGYRLSSEPDEGQGTMDIIDAENWEIDVPQQYLLLSVGKWDWEFEAVDLAGHTFTFYHGDIKITKDITHD